MHLKALIAKYLTNKNETHFKGTCECEDGFKMDSEGICFELQNECSNGVGQCPENSECVDEDKGFRNELT